MTDETKRSIEARVRDIVVEHLSVDPADVTPDASLIDDLAADSLDIVEMVMALEEEFKIDIPDEDTEVIETVQQIIDYVKAKTPG